MTIVNEGKAILKVSESDIVSKDLDVFYNPVMKFNRDSAIEFIKAYFDEPIVAALPLSGSGVRGVRFLLNKEFKEIHMNDLNPLAIKQIKSNMQLNSKEIKKVQSKSWKKIVKLSKLDANIFLRSKGKFDYIELDPYGSSVPFLDSAIISLKRNGVLAVTNTDTAALCGSYPKVTKRRYGSVPFNFAIRQQFGLRILIRKVQEIGFMHDKALVPIFSFAKDHYTRIYFKCIANKDLCEKILNETGFVESDKNRILKPSKLSSGKNVFGPIYLGRIQDKKLLKNIAWDDKFFKLIQNDSELDSLFNFYDPHEICKRNSLPVPNYEPLIKKLEEKKFKVLRTHYYKTALLSNAPSKDFLRILKQLAKKHK